MQVQQIYEILNDITGEVLGDTELLQEDLSNIVDVGNELFDAQSVDNYVKTLTDHIGRVVFVNRPYNVSVPSILRDAWEYGSVLEKITIGLPTATANESWSLTNGTSYDPNVFTAPTVTVKFYNSKVTFEVPMSFADRQVKESFSNLTQLNAFFSAIETAIYKSMSIKVESLIMRTINYLMAETVLDEYSGGTGLGDSSGVRAVNLLYLYNQQYPNAQLTVAQAKLNPDFIRFASYQMALYSDRMRKVSTLFNVGGTDKFTPSDMQHFVMLSEFGQAANVYLQSDTFHEEFTKLPNAEMVTYWQGSGTDYGFEDTSAINIELADDKSLSMSGILGVIFDHDACGVCNANQRITSYYNAKAEFTNQWFKSDGSYFVDLNENCIVFFIADPTNNG